MMEQHVSKSINETSEARGALQNERGDVEFAEGPGGFRAAACTGSRMPTALRPCQAPALAAQAWNPAQGKLATKPLPDKQGQGKQMRGRSLASAM